jgi:2-iminobutanoate/2-iminopropanoate deaminase
MSKTAVSTVHAPAAIGPYAQAVKAGDLVFCSGQIALDPATGEMVTGGVEAETRQVLENLTAVLEASGATWNDVVRTTIYLVDLGNFAVVNCLYSERVGATPPARATVQVSALPRGGLVEIDAIAHLSKASSSPAT